MEDEDDDSDRAKGSKRDHESSEDDEKTEGKPKRELLKARDYKVSSLKVHFMNCDL